MSARTTTGTPGALAPGVPGLPQQQHQGDVMPVVTGRPLGTRGSTEVIVTCPRCTSEHRHRGTGLRTAPCRLAYIVRLRQGAVR